MKARNAHLVGRCLVIDRRAFGDDEANIVFGTAFVILQHRVVGHAVGRKLPGHWRHSNAVLEGKFGAGKRGKENIGIHRAVSALIV